jgi:hypothetical protein
MGDSKFYALESEKKEAEDEGVEVASDLVNILVWFECVSRDYLVHKKEEITVPGCLLSFLSLVAASTLFFQFKLLLDIYHDQIEESKQMIEDKKEFVYSYYHILAIVMM